MSKQNYLYKDENGFFSEKFNALCINYYGNNVSQAKIAKDLKLKRQTISYYCNGLRVPSFLQLRNIINFFNEHMENFNSAYFFSKDEKMINAKVNFDNVSFSTNELSTINDIVKKDLINEFKILLNCKEEIINCLNTIKGIFTNYAYFRNKFITKMFEYDSALFFKEKFSILENYFKDLYAKTFNEEIFTKYYSDLEMQIEDMSEEKLAEYTQNLNKDFIDTFSKHFNNKKDSTD